MKKDFVVTRSISVLEGKPHVETISETELVRCKDCKHRDPEDFKCDCGHDIHWELPRPDNWFCADGEKEGEQG